MGVLFDYSDDTINRILEERSQTVLLDLRDSVETDTSKLCDTREIHKFLFKGLTKPGLEICVGNYRTDKGSKELNCEVFFGSHRGCPPTYVAEKLEVLRTKIRSSLRLLAGNYRNESEVIFLANLLHATAEILRDFILIHPYRDGNGHISRYIVCAIVIPRGYEPKRWRIHPRPEGDYAYAMRALGDQNNVALIDMLADDLLGNNEIEGLV